MRQLASILSELAVVGAASFGVAYAVEKKRQSHRKVAVPPKGSIVRIFLGTHIARCRFEGVSEGKWQLGPPITVGTTSAILAGHTVKGEVNAADGVILFRASIAYISPIDGRITLSTPEFSTFRDRRAEVRQRYAGTARLEGHEARVEDISPSGTRLRTRAKVVLGERVRVDFPTFEVPAFGWVLGIEQEHIRIRFEESLDVTNESTAGNALLK
jgi:PilZ domain